MKHLDSICKNCNYPFGSHRPEDNACPATEGGMDFAQGPGTTFEPKEKIGENQDSQHIGLPILKE